MTLDIVIIWTLEDVNSSLATVGVLGEFFAHYLPFPIPKDACANNNIKCPLIVNQVSQFMVSIKVEPGYPKIKTTLRVELNDTNNEYLVCQEFPAQLVDPSDDDLYHNSDNEILKDIQYVDWFKI